jgi:type IV secretion system protein VirB3
MTRDSAHEEEGLVADVLFVAATRPPTRWGVPFLALLINIVLTMEIFVMVRNPLVILLVVPIHGVCALMCSRDARIFEVLALWAQTRMPGLAGNLFAWRGNSYSPLLLDLPDARGRRRAQPTAQV